MLLVEHIHTGAVGSTSVWLRKVNLDLFFVDPELVEVCQTMREYFFHANIILVKKWVVPAYVTVTTPPAPRLCW